MLSLADWVLNAHHVDGNPQAPAHQALRHKLFSYYKEMDCKDLIRQEDDDYYSLTQEAEEKFLEFISDYDEYFLDGAYLPVGKPGCYR